jgi:hypothetical protein
MKHTITTTHDHTTGRDLFVVLTPDGFDAIGEGFETIGETLRAAIELSHEIDLSNLSRAELIDLAYYIDPNGSWDADEEGQQPITEAELINAIENILEESK